MIVNELRRMCGHDSRSVDGCTTCEAADEIERLRRDGFDSRHPAAQNLLGRNARLSIALAVVRDILADDCEPTPITAEHWEPIHDQVQSVIRERNELREEVERLRAMLSAAGCMMPTASGFIQLDTNDRAALDAAIDAAIGEEKRE